MADTTQTVVVKRGLSFSSVLFLIFLTAKLSGAVNWSWWIVFLPLYLVPALLIFGFLLICLVGFTLAMFANR